MQIEQERFEAWLFSQPLERVIEAAHANSCFLCSFLQETTNVQYPEFWEDVYSINYMNAAPSIPLPKWAMKLINLNELPQNSMCEMTVAQMQRRYRELFPEKGGDAVMAGFTENPPLNKSLTSPEQATVPVGAKQLP